MKRGDGSRKRGGVRTPYDPSGHAYAFSKYCLILIFLVSILCNVTSVMWCPKEATCSGYITIMQNLSVTKIKPCKGYNRAVYVYFYVH